MPGSIERFGAAAYGNGDVLHVPLVRAGHWVFATGMRATGPHGLIDPAVLREGRPLDAPPKAQREAQRIFERLQAQLREAGSAMDRVARLDQYYTDPAAVDPYHAARRQAMAGQVAPSTSVIVDGLLNRDAAVDVQALAATTASGYRPERVQAGLNAPQTSGYAPCLRLGKLVFVAGQLARDASGQLAAEAMPPPGQQWNGTRIRLETDYLVRKRLVPALEAAGTGLDAVLKAQVYLSHAQDLPFFWQSWAEAFEGRLPPTTVVPVRHPAFGTREATIEVNLVAAHGAARAEVRDIECDVSLLHAGMVAARKLDGLLFVAGLMALDEDGLAAAARVRPSAPFYHHSARAQMADILQKAQAIFRAAGSDLSNVTRALQFHADLADLHSCHGEWRNVIGAAGVPFSAVQVAPEMFLPGARVIVDLWGYAP